MREAGRLGPAAMVIVEGPLRISLWVRLAIGVGIVGLMTVKPDAFEFLVIMGAALAAGVGAAVHRHRRDIPAASGSEVAMTEG